MKNKDKWKPSKYVYHNKKLIGSRKVSELSVSSRLVADLVAAKYDELLPVHAVGDLLDLGCGKVPLYVAYKNYIADCTCVDWENTLHANQYIDYTCDLNNKLPFDDDSFDTIILSDVLEHIPEPGNLYAEMYRVLRNKGKLIMNVPFFYWIHESPYDFHRYTSFELERITKTAGFNLLHLEAIGGSPEVLTDIIVKHVHKVPLIGNTIAALFQSATKFFVNTSIGKKLSRRTSKQFPLGYFLVAQRNS